MKPRFPNPHALGDGFDLRVAQADGLWSIPPMIAIRAEHQEDISAIRRINELAFGGTQEADLVDRLRTGRRLLVSLVAEQESQLLGHIAFSPVTLGTQRSPCAGAGLGPMTVIPGRQRQGVGSLLVCSGLGQCQLVGIRSVVVVGHPSYYPRFGFVPAGRFGIRCAYEVPDEAFMAMELDVGALRGATGTVHYEPEFDGV